MADEVEADQATEAAPVAGEALPTETQTAETAAPTAAVAAPSGRWGFGLLALALLAVVLTVAGVFSMTKPKPNPWELGLGLLLWGILDLAAQARGLVSWKGSRAAVGNVVNLLRGLGLLGLGLWLLMIGTGLLHAVNPAVVLWTLVCLVFLYLASVLVLEMLIDGLRMGGQAFLLASLVLMFFSYFYFSIPFTFSWAALLAGLAFVLAAMAVHRGALSQSRSLTVAVLLVVVGLSAPLLDFAYQQAFEVQEQPLFTPTLLVPRMRQILKDLGPTADQIRWAPVDTQPGVLGDTLFSDKVALVDQVQGHTVIKLFQQHANGLRELLRVPAAADVSLTAFSNDGRRLSYTFAQKSKAELEGVLEPSKVSVAMAETLTAAPVSPSLPPFSLRRLKPWLEALWHSWTTRASQAPVGTMTADTATAKTSMPPFSWHGIKPWMLAHWHAWKAGPVEVAPEFQAASGDLAYQVRILNKDVEPGPSHGQVWRALGKQLYFAAPAGGPRNPLSSVWRYDFNQDKAERLLKGRAYPAVSFDGKSLLSVGFKPKTRSFEIADEERGDYGDLVLTDERPFDAARETSYFPAWNDAQTEVLYLDNAGDGLMIMDANGHHRRPFDPKNLDSEHWKTSSRVPFMLRWVTIGDTYSVYRTKPNGSQERLVYATEARDISPPQWSADGQRVAFIVRRWDGSSRIFTVGSDGSWPRFFFATKDALDELKWSPDSLRLAWICRREGGPEEIWTAGYEGLDPERVHVDRGHIQTLTWSPRGKHLAVQQTYAWTFLGLRIIRPDLRTVLMVDLVDDHARVMTRYGLMSWDPNFSPHGDAIAYFTDEHPWAWRPIRKRMASLVVSQLY